MRKRRLDLFKGFFQSERAGGFVLIGCTVISLIIANTGLAESYQNFWLSYIDLSFFTIQLNYSIEHWVNDGLMTVFFLLVGLEIERELYVGELATFKNALLPIIAATGGLLLPAFIHLIFNYDSATQAGFGIPMATDIAFALGMLSLAGKRIPVSLKIFLTALAIIDDLGAITVIALFYTKGFLASYFFAALSIFLILFIAGKRKVYGLPLYIIGGIVMWYCMLKSGVHATISGILLAFAIPFHKEYHKNPSYKLQKFLHFPVAFLILPIFSLTNTAITFPQNFLASLSTNNSIGIMLGLIIGKMAGIFLFSYLGVKAMLANLPSDLKWIHIFGVSILGGIGFTMSIFITNLAFNNPEIIVASKFSILIASFCAAILGIYILKVKAFR